MSLWSRYIAWTDANIRKSGGSRYSLSASLPMLPMFASAPFMFLFEPTGTLRDTIFATAITASAGFFGIWVWRLIPYSFKQKRARDKRKATAQRRAREAVEKSVGE